MALGIYGGIGGVHNVKDIYVGAGGVKNVKEAYIGVGGAVKRVWPPYVDGQSLFSTDMAWYRYLRDYDRSSWTQVGSSSMGDNDYISTGSWFRLLNGYGGYFCSGDLVYADSLDYLYVDTLLYDTRQYSQWSYYSLYCSISSNRTTFPSSDSGNGVITQLRASNYTGEAYHRYYTIDLRSCSRTGYFKMGVIITSNLEGTGDDSGHFRIYAPTPTVKTSATSVNLTVT